LVVFPFLLIISLFSFFSLLASFGFLTHSFFLGFTGFLEVTFSYNMTVDLFANPSGVIVVTHRWTGTEFDNN